MKFFLSHKIVILKYISMIFLFISCVYNTKQVQIKEQHEEIIDTSPDCCVNIVCSDTSVVNGSLNNEEINGVFNLRSDDDKSDSLETAIIILKNKEKKKIGILCFNFRNQHPLCEPDFSSINFRFHDGCVASGESYKIQAVNSVLNSLKIFYDSNYLKGSLNLTLYSKEKVVGLPDSITLEKIQFCKKSQNK
jgi:hypothetical protein